MVATHRPQKRASGFRNANQLPLLARNETLREDASSLAIDQYSSAASHHPIVSVLRQSRNSRRAKKKANGGCNALAARRVTGYEPPRKLKPITIKTHKSQQTILTTRS